MLVAKNPWVVVALVMFSLFYSTVALASQTTINEYSPLLLLFEGGSGEFRELTKSGKGVGYLSKRLKKEDEFYKNHNVTIAHVDGKDYWKLIFASDETSENVSKAAMSINNSKYDPVVIVGHSMGAIIAWATAIRVKNLRALVTLDGVSFDAPNNSEHHPSNLARRRIQPIWINVYTSDEPKDPLSKLLNTWIQDMALLNLIAWADMIWSEALWGKLYIDNVENIHIDTSHFEVEDMYRSAEAKIKEALIKPEEEFAPVKGDTSNLKELCMVPGISINCEEATVMRRHLLTVETVEHGWCVRTSVVIGGAVGGLVSLVLPEPNTVSQFVIGGGLLGLSAGKVVCSESYDEEEVSFRIKPSTLLNGCLETSVGSWAGFKNFCSVQVKTSYDGKEYFYMDDYNPIFPGRNITLMNVIRDMARYLEEVIRNEPHDEIGQISKDLTFCYDNWDYDNRINFFEHCQYDIQTPELAERVNMIHKEKKLAAPTSGRTLAGAALADVKLRLEKIDL